MGKITKPKRNSLKWSFFIYIPVCFFISLAGSYFIGILTNHLQDWYTSKHNNAALRPSNEYYTDNNTDIKTEAYTKNVFFIISNGQFILIPLWCAFCVGMTGMLFYNRELKKPLSILTEASKKIAENKLDFSIEYPNKNELGLLCESFEYMRASLVENNHEMWRSLEERKRLNAAFSHDLRTPLTVIRGYSDFLCSYAPGGKIDDDKIISTLNTMNSHIDRLERYINGMSSVHKLEDIIPCKNEISAESLRKMLEETADTISANKQIEFEFYSENDVINLDSDMVIEVYENILSNANRYAENKIKISCTIIKSILEIAVEDDGKGFSDDGIKHCTDPFFRDEKEKDKTHFGLGLYISKIICEKHGGSLSVCNNTNGGGKVTAKFSV